MRYVAPTAVRTSRASADSPSEDMLPTAAEITPEDIAANIEFTRRFCSPLMKAMNARGKVGNLTGYG
jgi:hypothetical protein